MIPSALTRVTHSAEVGSLQPRLIALQGSAPVAAFTEDGESAFHWLLVALVAHQEEAPEPITKALVPANPSGEFTVGVVAVAEFLS